MLACCCSTAPLTNACLAGRYEKRGIALNVPRVDMDKCTQCNYCSLICPHAAVRPFLSTAKDLENAPEGFKKGSRKAIGGGALDNYNFRVQVFPAPCFARGVEEECSSDLQRLSYAQHPGAW
jgi:Fe-S-cluster-containing hydrogenase component 2